MRDYRQKIIEIIKLWPEYQDIDFATYTTENLLALIKDAVISNREKLENKDINIRLKLKKQE